MEKFLAAHPGASIAAQLDGPNMDEGLLHGLVEEQEKIANTLRRWKDSAGEILGEERRRSTRFRTPKGQALWFRNSEKPAF